MARKAKKRDETPDLRMIVEGLRLVPAFAFEAERLASYRNGAKVIVSITLDQDRPLVRKWWAIIGWYLKNTQLPWGDKETASAAIKLALTIIEPFKMPSGQWAQYPLSLTEVDDADLEGKIREMQQLLYEITGIDQETMRREGGSEGDEQFETNPPADNDAGDETLAGDPLPSTPTVASEEDSSAGKPDAPHAQPGAAVTNSQAEACEHSSLDSTGANAENGDVDGSVCARPSGQEIGAQPQGVGSGNLVENTSGPDDKRAPVSPETAMEQRENVPSQHEVRPGSASLGAEQQCDTLGVTGGESAAIQSEADACQSPSASEPAPEETAPPPAEPSGADTLSEQDRLWLKNGARMILACMPSKDPESLRVLVIQLHNIRSMIPEGVSRDALTRMEAIRLHVMAVCKAGDEINWKLIAANALATIEEITPDGIIVEGKDGEKTRVTIDELKKQASK